MKFSNFYNPLMIWLLNSSLHSVVSRHFMILHFKGRKSGKPYAVPVEYFDFQGGIGVFTHRSRIWWKNLQNNASAQVQLQGKRLDAETNTLTDDKTTFEQALMAYLSKYPGREKAFKIRGSSDSKLNQDDIQQQSAAMVLITVHLT